MTRAEIRAREIAMESERIVMEWVIRHTPSGVHRGIADKLSASFATALIAAHNRAVEAGIDTTYSHCGSLEVIRDEQGYHDEPCGRCEWCMAAESLRALRIHEEAPDA